jgi:hypothetical protein
MMMGMRKAAWLFSVIVVGLGSGLPSSAFAKEPFQRELNIAFSALSPLQKKVFGTYAQASCKNIHDEACWGTLSESQKVTFDAVTHALESKKVTPSQKNPDGNALGLVAAIRQIHGGEEHARSAEQFNLQVDWIPHSKKMFKKSGFKNRPGLGHIGEQGVGEGRPGFTGLHVLFDTDGDGGGHVHVDFRHANWFYAIQHFFHLGRGKGHFEAYNSNVSAVGPERSKGSPIDNLAIYEQWYGPLPGVSQISIPAVNAQNTIGIETCGGSDPASIGIPVLELGE